MGCAPPTTTIQPQRKTEPDRGKLLR
ncbi:MAG: hypothetical protein QOE89_2032, partial [Pseudonocardiales bacterium]|nr:hypothetical protein [Pseudonocardiales bacterium]